MDYVIKPWYTARWETVEPEEPVYNGSETEYNEPSNNELIDMEFGYEYQN
ncbi:hypothetical protein AVV67_gp083 [Escherichia phage vB_EcoM_VR25]|uniref:Uncharacterized protein n=1 Tax=Escherichia phage vB_EcoM_VR25 TaxID=1567028 RepID=A0A0A7HCG8_9CAUD|nr:hypothetical protein AVV67_gp083 [Escherichia phage vB_EcoM_VR25]AIZ02427.1 hypothetical protein VR25_083 [Escherichia phage vB_EcoM_VR25]